MKRTLVHALLATTMVASLGSLTPAPAAPACSRCVIEGVVSMGGYVPDPTAGFSLYGTFAGLRVMDDIDGPLGVWGSVQLQGTVTEVNNNGYRYEGTGTLLLSTSIPCACDVGLHRRTSTASVNLQGGGYPFSWTITPDPADGTQAEGVLVLSPHSTTTPVGQLEFAGRISVRTL